MGTRRNYLLDVAVVDRQSSELVVRYRWNGDDKPAFERNPSTWGSIPCDFRTISKMKATYSRSVPDLLKSVLFAI